jgi:V8-like Glu-specific endopeptidase
MRTMVNMSTKVILLMCGLLAMTAKVKAYEGGELATIGQFPTVGIIFLQNGGGISADICSGVMISPTILMTAAHCAYPFEKLTNIILKGDSGTETPNIKSVYLHPQRVKNPIISSCSSPDVGLIELTSPTKFPQAIVDARPIIQPGSFVEVEGYGYTSNNEDPMSVFTNPLTGAEKQVKDINGTCFTVEPKNKNGVSSRVSHGDSGSPVYYRYSNGQLGVVGITSFADEPWIGPHIDNFTRLDDKSPATPSVSDWIGDVLAGRVQPSWISPATTPPHSQ